MMLGTYGRALIVEPILEILAPLALLIALGSALAHIRFLGTNFIADLNKLAFWIALPALVFTSASKGIDLGMRVWVLLGVLLSATVLVSALAWAASYALRLPDNARGTLAQSAFRGNLAYIGLPVLINSFNSLPTADSQKTLTTAVMVVVLTMAFYNILAVIVLQLSQHSPGGVKWKLAARSIGTNPLLLAGVFGLIIPLLHVTLPLFVQKTLDLLSAAAVPIALLCIGGSLVTIPLHGKKAGIIAAALMKTAVLPLIVFGFGRLAGFDAVEQRIALVLSSCPTAAAAFVMARQMGGDEALASASIALSTVLSAISLAIALSVGS